MTYADSHSAWPSSMSKAAGIIELHRHGPDRLIFMAVGRRGRRAYIDLDGSGRMLCYSGIVRLSNALRSRLNIQISIIIPVVIDSENVHSFATTANWKSLPLSINSYLYKSSKRLLIS